MRNLASNITLALILTMPCITTHASTLSVKLATSSLRYIPERKAELFTSEQKAWAEKAARLLSIIYAGRAGYSADVNEIIYEAKRSDLNPTFVFAAIENLSAFNELHEDANGNIGLLAIQNSIHTELGNKQNTLYQGKYNLRLGCSIIRALLDENNGNLAQAMHAFLSQVSKQHAPSEKYSQIIELWQRRARQINDPIPPEFAIK